MNSQSSQLQQQQQQNKRKILMFKDNIKKIINFGIRPNLQKLEKSSKLIKLNNKNDHSVNRLLKEYINSQLTVQQLRNNLSELEKCYIELKELNAVDTEYSDDVIISIRKEVLKAIENFIKTNGEIDSKLYSDDEENTNQTANGVAKLQANIEKEMDSVSNAQDRFKEIESLNRDLQDLHEMMLKFGNMVHEQQPQVDQIEQNIEIAHECIQEGNKSLAKAASYSIAPIACAAIGASIFGPIGALVSFKISTGIASALGGSVLSYSLASYAKRNKEIEFDDQNQIENGEDVVNNT